MRERRENDAIVDVEWSAVSSGTERLLWSGRMPSFPGMGYPLVPGYESVGRIAAGGCVEGFSAGTSVFLPGSHSFVGAKNLFGGNARRLLVPKDKLVAIDERLGEAGTLLALAATAHHAAPTVLRAPPDLIVGHGVLGRLIARLALIAGGPPPVVWEVDPARRHGAVGYPVIAPDADDRRNYTRICDVSGAGGIVETLLGRLAPQGELILAGFYEEPISFNFPTAFMREARLRVSAQWQPADMQAVAKLVADGSLSLDGLISHVRPVDESCAAYRQAFEDRGCLKMVLDWRVAA